MFILATKGLSIKVLGKGGCLESDWLNLTSQIRFGSTAFWLHDLYANYLLYLYLNFFIKKMYYNGVCFITLLSGLDEKETRSRTVTDMLLLSRPVMSSSLQHHGPQHGRPPCPSPSPEVCPGSCPLHWWSHPSISSSDALFSFWHIVLTYSVDQWP